MRLPPLTMLGFSRFTQQGSPLSSNEARTQQTKRTLFFPFVTWYSIASAAIMPFSRSTSACSVFSALTAL